jgi:Abnormal spindle-like microcephaly-assoc'd, ASPM-SPD-2-Hydin
MPKRYSLGPLLAATILLIGCGAPVVPTPLTGSQLMASSGVQFGTVPIGGTRSSSVAVSNPADGADIVISRINVAGPGFRLGSVPALPMTIAPGESVTLGIEFAPEQSGAAKGNVAIVSDATNSVLPVSLTGNGNSSAQIVVSPSALNFGNVGVGTSAVLSGTLIAANSDVTVSTVDETGSGYSLSGITFPVTIPAGQQLPFSVTFAPQAAGAATGSLSFVTNASSSPTATLTGSGSSPATAHSVNLSWSASTSAAAYNIYRSAQSGGPYAKLTGSPTPATNFADTSVQSGSTYYYVATSVNNNSQESGYSNQTAATIP